MNKRDLKFVEILLGDEEKQAVMEALNKAYLASGEYIELFEKEFAKYIGTKYAIAVSNGTDGLFLAYLALGLTFKKKVLTTPISFMATASTIIHSGAIPIFSDVAEDMNLDPHLAREVANKEKVDGITIVHLFGKPATPDEFRELSDTLSVPLIEDASHAHGAIYKGKKIGQWGDIAVFSLYPTKVIAAGGWGGVITTNDEEIYEKILYLRAHGEERVKLGKEGAYIHSRLGYNLRMSNLEAAVAYYQLKRIEDFINKRRRNAAILREILSNHGNLVLPSDAIDGRNVYYIFNVTIKNCNNELMRDRIVKNLKEEGVPAEKGYHIPLHRQPLFLKINDPSVNHFANIVNYPDYSKVYLPNSERLTKCSFWLPVHPGLTEEDMEFIGEKTLEVLRKEKI